MSISVDQLSSDGINKHIIYTDGTELYKIPIFSRYLASKDGRIFSKNYNNSGKIAEIIGKVDKDGYRELLLRDDNGNRKYVRRHILIAITFIPNPDNLPQVNHKHGINIDNFDAVNNLEWCDQSYNIKHSHRVLGWSKNKPIIQYYGDKIIARYSSPYEAEEKTGIKSQHIWACLHGKQRTTGGFSWVYESEVVANVIGK